MAQQAIPGKVPDGAAAELVRRSVATILAQTRFGRWTVLAMGAALGILFVPAVGWPPYLAWYAVLVGAMVVRQRYFNRLMDARGASADTLRRVALVAAVTGWLVTVSIPLFAGFLAPGDLGVLTVMSIGWVTIAVAVLGVEPPVYTFYLVASFLTILAGWAYHASARDLLLLAIGMLLGGPMLVRLAQMMQRQLSDAVRAGQENALLVGQLREALASQQEAQRARSRFLGAASHDLRQPVQALLFLSDIFRRSTDPARRDAMAQQIVRTGESIDGMFRHLVDFAQIDAGMMKAVLQPVQLDQLVAAAVSGFAEKCAARGLRFRMQVAGPCTVSADPVLLERMLRNFLDNAYKYSLRGEIQLRVHFEDDEAVVCVSDQGVGMEPEDLAQACNAFFRGRSASVAEAEGIGLGLAISRHMADLMHTPLKIESQPQAGTKVTIRLPLLPRKQERGQGGDPDCDEALLRGRLVAVVENDRQAREALCAWLLESGARVAQASSSAQLMEVLETTGEAPDLVLADYGLSEGTGVDAVAAVRARYGAVPAWIVSGDADVAERRLPLPVLQKPITPERLLCALRSAFPAVSQPGS